MSESQDATPVPEGEQPSEYCIRRLIAAKLRALPYLSEKEIGDMTADERKRLQDWIIGTLDRMTRVLSEVPVHLNLFGDDEELSRQVH